MKFRSNSLSTAIITASLCLSAPFALAQSDLTTPAKPKANGIGVIVQPDLAACAPGFKKFNEVKTHLGKVVSFECRTPIIHCPHNPNYTQVVLKGKADGNANQNPESAALRLRYSCKYFTPEG